MLAQRAYQRAMSLSFAGAMNFQVPARFLSLKPGTFKFLLASCRFLSPSEL
ncbi:hypothetical protein A2U01_0080110, partial [Trifolium medium]|nr:hypothetical protein [Trifolium medium]